MFPALGRIIRGPFTVMAAAVVGTALGMLTVINTADAASCWNHNGSIMQLSASGNYREFRYWNPKAVLQRAGVRRGTLLFNGNKSGDWYSGTARRFSKFCPGTPLEYSVEGPVSSSQTKVTVKGQRQIYKKCQPTGRWANDTLVFTYSHQC